MVEEEFVKHSEQQIWEAGDGQNGDSSSNATGEASFIKLWELVDVVGSPTLTGLIGVLTVDECENFSILDLSGNGLEFQVNKTFESKILHTCSNTPQLTLADECFWSEMNQPRQARWSLPRSPLNELYSFPVSRIVLRDNTCRNTRSYPKTSGCRSMSVGRNSGYWKSWPQMKSRHWKIACGILHGRTGMWASFESLKTGGVKLLLQNESIQDITGLKLFMPV
jgi:hypothetical protein